MAKYLIVNADDCGMCAAANQAIFELLEGGFLKSTTIMMPCAYAEEAVQYSIAHPEFAMGIHLTMTAEWADWRWKSLSGGKSLHDEEGYMWHESIDVSKNAKLDELEAEIRAQVDKALRMGMKPSHLDNHMGSLYGHIGLRFELLKMTLRVCGEYGYAFRMYKKADKRVQPVGVPYIAYAATAKLGKYWADKYRVLLPDYLLFPHWTKELRSGTYEDYKKHILNIWTNIPDGVTETFIHPVYECDEIKAITGSWQDRVWEYQLMKDPETHTYLKQHGIELISYRDLIAMNK